MPLEMMREWVDQTVDRILSLKPRKLLEVGCGLGLLLFKLIEQVKIYKGMDYSSSAIRYVQENLSSRSQPVELQVGEAKDIDKIYSGEDFDVIVLNSIIQYFPNLDYLIEVLNKSIELTQAEGYIFIGDVRSLVHLSMFHAAVQFYQSAEKVSWVQWKANVDYYVFQEEELLIDHRFFYALKKLNPRISHVDIKIKYGQYNSEMNQFRYDVILYIEHKSQALSLAHTPQFDWCKDSLTLSQLQLFLEKNHPLALVVVNVPNKRVAGLKDISSYDKFNSPEWRRLASQHIFTAQKRAISPEEFYSLGQKLGYNISITWAEKKPSCDMDIILLQKDADLLLTSSQIFSDELHIKLSKYINIPLQAKLISFIFLNLKKFLRSKLPAYMIPNTLIALEALPMNINGKIDRQALPSCKLNARNIEFMPPETKLEKQLTKIWSKVLKLDQIGVHDNFYDLGGTSLLAVVIISEIHKVFSVHLNVEDIIFNGQTTYSLSLLLSEKLAVLV